MATFNKYKITSKDITLTFKAWGFSKDITLDFVQDKDKIQKVKSIVSKALAYNADDNLEFEYEGNDIEADRELCKKCLLELQGK